MSAAFELLRLRQAMTREQFAAIADCQCNRSTATASFQGLNSGGGGGFVQSGTSVQPVKIIGGGWINPREAMPIVTSGNIRYAFSMPQGAKGR